MGFDDFKLPPLKELKDERRENSICKKCNDTGIVKESNGSVHVCFDCLNAGRLDVHTKDLKKSGVKI
ncbi:hypothetical protein COU57_04800 [Candidatus Pacearchaeota archaeon CG10_big_fil_rev_8_21_14_0_10_32_14]|nr:MAG: hypothetical protein COU57_04800 [Candidatus Pacearchaeota archaeon CG10_big_fil_rev_8_21_14_0_10_32_14]